MPLFRQYVFHRAGRWRHARGHDHIGSELGDHASKAGAIEAAAREVASVERAGFDGEILVCERDGLTYIYNASVNHLNLEYFHPDLARKLRDISD